MRVLVLAGGGTSQYGNIEKNLNNLYNLHSKGQTSIVHNYSVDEEPTEFVAAAVPGKVYFVL